MDTRRAFLALADKMEPALRRAFLEAFTDIRSNARMSVLEASLERGDVAGVIQALNLRDEFFEPLDRQISEAFYQGGVFQLSNLPKKTLPNTGPLVVRFSTRTPRAEEWVRANAARLVVQVTEDQKEAIRQTVEAGLAAGEGPRKMALQIAGRMEGNRRTGGIVGLTSKQAGAVTRMRAELRDPDLMAGYFQRTRRDKRYDSIVRRAMKDGKPVAEADIARVTGRYADRLLALRGETIARTEAIRALNAGKFEGIMQMVESGQIPADAVTVRWMATPGLRTRDTHRIMNDQRKRLGEPFESPSGARMRYPGDTSLGAPAEEVINCRCSLQPRVDWLSLAV